jgi:hypothetical protein
MAKSDKLRQQALQEELDRQCKIAAAATQARRHLEDRVRHLEVWSCFCMHAAMLPHCSGLIWFENEKNMLPQPVARQSQDTPTVQQAMSSLTDVQSCSCCRCLLQTH